MQGHDVLPLMQNRDAAGVEICRVALRTHSVYCLAWSLAQSAAAMAWSFVFRASMSSDPSRVRAF
jgi:hypothetical protein